MKRIFFLFLLVLSSPAFAAVGFIAHGDESGWSLSPDFPHIATEATICFYARVNDISVPYPFTFDDTIGGNHNIYMHFASVGEKYYLVAGTTASWAMSLDGAYPMEWVHCAAIRTGDAGIVRLYVNGVYQNQTYGIQKDVPGKVRVLAGSPASSFWEFSGEIFDFRIYDRALSESELSRVALNWGGDDVISGRILRTFIHEQHAENTQLGLAGNLKVPGPAMTTNNTPSPYACDVSQWNIPVNPAYLMFDNDPSKYWNSAGAVGAGDWITLDTGYTRTMESITVNNYPPWGIATFTLYGSNDGSSWTSIVTLNVENSATDMTRTFTQSAAYRHYKIADPTWYTPSYGVINEIYFTTVAATIVQPRIESTVTDNLSTTASGECRVRASPEKFIREPQQ